MAPVYMTSRFAQNLKKYSMSWIVTIEDSDNESYDYEVSAPSADEAAHKATALAAADGIYDVYNMFIAQC